MPGNKVKHGRGGRHKPHTLFFEPFWDQKEVDEAIARNEVVVGPLGINRKNRHEAYVKTKLFKRDVFIDGDKDRNRALNGDIVAVKLFDKSQWRKRDNEEEISKSLNALSLINSTSKPLSDVDIELWDPQIPENDVAAKPRENEKTANNDSGMDDFHGQPCGRVVRILAANEASGMSLDRIGAATHFGFLAPQYGYEREKNPIQAGHPLPSDETTVEFRPLDNRLPFIMIPRSQVPHDFVTDPSRFKPPNHRLVEVAIEQWSPGFRHPMGRFVRIVGEAGEIGPETEALLVATNCDHGEFPEEAMNYVNETVGEGWTIPVEEVKKRRDLRDYCIFTVDPATAKDLDDALSCVKIAAGEVKGRDGRPLPAHFEIGVHIADVSYFLPNENALDEEAQRRATSVYLVNKVIPMLPPILCEELCSLNEGVDRLAYSCIWRMTADGDMLPNAPAPWYGRTVIRSCARLDYGTAQKILDGTVTAASTDTGNVEDPACWPQMRQPYGNFSKQRVIDDLRNMGSIAKARRERRFNGGGALQLHTVKLYFKLNNEGNPIGVTEYPLRFSNFMIEEYMLMANYLVAQKLIQGIQKKAFIRFHPPPDPKQLQEAVTQFSKLGINIDATEASSAHGMHLILQRLAATESKNVQDFVMNILVKKPLQQARYCVAGSRLQHEWRHWALNIPYYTHFTSPIRRYADVMVHRLLTAILDGTANEYPLSMDNIQEIAMQCNDKKEAAKEAQTASDRLYLCVMIKKRYEMGDPMITHGIIDDMGPNSINILFNEYGVDTRLRLEGDWNCSDVIATYEDVPQDAAGSKSKSTDPHLSAHHGKERRERNNDHQGKGRRGGKDGPQESKTHRKDKHKDSNDKQLTAKDEKKRNVESLSFKITPLGGVESIRLSIRRLDIVEVVLHPSQNNHGRIDFAPKFLSLKKRDF